MCFFKSLEILTFVPLFEQMYSNKLDISKKMDNYFSKNLAFLREAKDLSMLDLAAIIGMGKSIIGNYEKGTAEPSATTVLKIVQYFGVSLVDLMTKDLSLAVHRKKLINAQPTAQVNAQPILENTHTSYTKSVTTIEHVVDTSGHRLVPVVDIKAAAGDGYINAENLQSTDVLRLPVTMVKSGHHLCIRIKGISMAPTLQDGGFLVIRLLERSEWLNMPNERIYVVVTSEGKTYIKRVKNRFSGEKGFIVLNSDSPDKSSHPSFNLYHSDIQHIWYVEWYFTAKMPNVHDQYYNRVSSLEDKVDLLAEEMTKMKNKLK